MRAYYDRDADINLIAGQESCRGRIRQPEAMLCAQPEGLPASRIVALHRAQGLGFGWRRRKPRASAGAFEVAEAAKGGDVIMMLTPGRAAGRHLSRSSARCQHGRTARRSCSPTASTWGLQPDRAARRHRRADGRPRRASATPCVRNTSAGGGVPCLIAIHKVLRAMLTTSACRMPPCHRRRPRRHHRDLVP